MPDTQPVDLADLRRRHTRCHTVNPGRYYCPADNQDWPCDVTRLLEALDAARGDASALAAATWSGVEAAEAALALAADTLRRVKLTAGPVMNLDPEGITLGLHNGGACKACGLTHSMTGAGELNTAILAERAERGGSTDART